MKTGDSIRVITFPADSVDGAVAITATGTQTLHYEEQNLGEYGIGWVVVTKNGVEAERHNIRFLESIVLNPPQQIQP